MKYLKVEGHESLYRDSTTKAIINNSITDYNKYINQKRAMEKKQSEVERQAEEINNIKEELSEIKSLLQKILEK